MGTHKSVAGREKYNNGRRVFRQGGRFAKPPALVAGVDFLVCPECRRFCPSKVEPEYVNGFVDPVSMHPKMPTHCHACGAELAPLLPGPRR